MAFSPASIAPSWSPSFDAAIAASGTVIVDLSALAFIDEAGARYLGYDTNKIPSSNQEGGMDVLNAAMQQCADAAPDGVGER